jgi:cysteine-rich repeat protein
LRRFKHSAAFVLAALAACASPATAAQQCQVTFRVDGAELLGGLELRVDYSGAGGTFNGTGGDVKCTGLAPASTQAARDDDAGAELNLGLISGPGFFLPQNIWRCDFTASGAAPAADDFAFTVDEALTPESEPMTVDASVSAITCDTGAFCGDGVIEADEECDDGDETASCTDDCQLTRNSQRCAVTFAATGSGSLGGVQFGVDYSDASGEFQGEGIDVDCSDALPSSYTVVDDVDASQQLNLAMISPGGVALPTDLWTCTFVTSATALVKSNFQYVDVAATDVEARAKNVTLSAKVAGCVYGPYCGDGIKDAGESCDDGNSVDNDSCSNACAGSLCGNGVKNGPEQCDDGNTTSGDCCSSGCTFESTATVCRAAAGVCDVAESCTGTSAACPFNQFKSSSTACTDDSNVCTDDKCNGSGTCTHAANTASCNDGFYCNGTDTCSGGACGHAGNPCPGADGDGDCSETCNESSDNCTANDTNGSQCNDGSSATGPDACQNGQCIGGTGAICGDADENGSINTTDALRALRNAVGQPTACPLFVCDVNDNGTIQTSDALGILRKAVGQPITLNCPAES